MIYFVLSPDGAAVKIGRSDNPGARLRELQTAHHQALCLMAVFDWPDDHERFLHREFAAYRLSGEWFAAQPDVLQYIEESIAERDEPINRERRDRWMLNLANALLVAYLHTGWGDPSDANGGDTELPDWAVEAEYVWVAA